MWVSILIFVALCTYLYIIFKLSRGETKKSKQTPLKLYKEHFGDEQGETFLNAVKNYYWETVVILSLSFAVMLGLAYLTLHFDISFLVVVCCTLMIVIVLVLDRVTHRLCDAASNIYHPSLFGFRLSGEN